MYEVANNLRLHPVRKISIQLGMLCVELVASTLLVYLVAFTFGASLVDNFLNNLVFALLVVSISFMPAFVLLPHTNPLILVIRLFVDRNCETTTEEMCMRVTYGCALGAWTGCLVLPLDWDRWWQQWPLPCCFGAVMGACLAALIYLISPLLGNSSNDANRQKHH